MKASLIFTALAALVSTGSAQVLEGTSCTEGSMRCVALSGLDQRYNECINGVFRLVTCGSGTYCHSDGENAVFCGYKEGTEVNAANERWAQDVQRNGGGNYGSYGAQQGGNTGGSYGSNAGNAGGSYGAQQGGNNGGAGGYVAGAGGYGGQCPGPIPITLNPVLPTYTITGPPQKTIVVTRDIVLNGGGYNGGAGGYNAGGYNAVLPTPQYQGDAYGGGSPYGGAQPTGPVTVFTTDTLVFVTDTSSTQTVTSFVTSGVSTVFVTASTPTITTTIS
ncbi:hypothetical protein H4219_001266 [Mycoemilia scoparia]|uniref:Uncharacterized protein n=1 Tax=Mycoemilia scoparia TaxID=417184 RepID=A0A9W8A0R6_9FUNG|nr:hypothetical protein H4219_001266 [Mycoemilia scoparia]